MTFVVGLAVFHLHETAIVFSLSPIVAVIGIEVTFIETKLRQQHRITGQLIETAQQSFWTFCYHKENIEILLCVAQFHKISLCVAEIVKTRLEGVPHHAVAFGAPIERSRRSYATIHPVVGVFNGNHLSAMRETAVLHTTSIEVFAFVVGKSEVRAVFVKSGSCERLENFFSASFFYHKTTRSTVENDRHLRSRHREIVGISLQIE